MSLNRKLTPLISGRTIQSGAYRDGLLEIHFTDGSHLRIKATGAGQLDSLPGQTVKAIRQKDTSFYVDFADGTTATLPLAEAMSSVLLRDKDDILEYAD